MRKIVISLILILQITDNETLNIPTTENKKNQEVPTDISSVDHVGNIGHIENLSTTTKSAKFKKPKLAKTKKSNFTKANSSRKDFLISEAKKPLYIYKKLLSRL